MEQNIAQQQEQLELERAMLRYLRERVVLLNVEVQKRDARIAELEASMDSDEKMKEESEVQDA